MSVLQQLLDFVAAAPCRILVQHQAGSKQLVHAFGDTMLQQISECSKYCPRITVVHETSQLGSIKDSYAKSFAPALQSSKQFNVRHVAIIQKSMSRVLARFAAKLAQVEIEIVRDFSQLEVILT